MDKSLLTKLIISPLIFLSLMSCEKNNPPSSFKASPSDAMRILPKYCGKLTPKHRDMDNDKVADLYVSGENGIGYSTSSKKLLTGEDTPFYRTWTRIDD